MKTVINVNTAEVIYIDKRAKTDANAQEIIHANITKVL